MGDETLARAAMNRTAVVASVLLVATVVAVTFACSYRARLRSMTYYAESLQIELDETKLRLENLTRNWPSDRKRAENPKTFKDAVDQMHVEQRKMLEEREQRCLLNDLEIRVADPEQQRRVRDQVEQQKLIDELQEMVQQLTDRNAALMQQISERKNLELTQEAEIGELNVTTEGTF